MAPRLPRIAFDIDGVLVRGAQTLPTAREALRKVRDANVPHVFLTNGGGIPETRKALELSRALDLEVSPKQVVLAHTPMKALVPKYRRKRCMVLGCRDETEVAKMYGFEKIVTPQEFARQHEHSYPFFKYRHDARAVVEVGNDPYFDQPIEAVLILHDSIDWHLEIQVLLDVLSRRDPISEAYGLKNPPKIYNSNDDFEFANEFKHPRMAQGAFLEALFAVHSKKDPEFYENRTIDDVLVRFGKPHAKTFDFAERLLNSQNPDADGPLVMIGDNPLADIVGANRNSWQSVLVRTGVYCPIVNPAASDLSAHEELRPSTIEDCVEKGVDWAMAR